MTYKYEDCMLDAEVARALNGANSQMLSVISDMHMHKSQYVEVSKNTHI